MASGGKAHGNLNTPDILKPLVGGYQFLYRGQAGNAAEILRLIDRGIEDEGINAATGHRARRNIYGCGWAGIGLQRVRGTTTRSGVERIRDECDVRGQRVADDDAGCLRWTAIGYGDAVADGRAGDRLGVGCAVDRIANDAARFGEGQAGIGTDDDAAIASRRAGRAARAHRSRCAAGTRSAAAVGTRRDDEARGAVT